MLACARGLVVRDVRHTPGSLSPVLGNGHLALSSFSVDMLFYAFNHEFGDVHAGSAFNTFQAW